MNAHRLLARAGRSTRQAATPPRATPRWLRFALFVSVPLVLLPILLPRKVAARRSGAETSAEPVSGSTRARQIELQSIVDELKTRLSLASDVVVSIVPKNTLLVSIERLKDRPNAFDLSLEAGFLEQLSPEEIQAVVAHELGHVWIFTHHPYLQTEELANEIALRVVDRRTLADVYDKVWAKTGQKGALVYLPEAP